METWEMMGGLVNRVDRPCTSSGHKFARDVALAGLPTINRSKIFNWPVRRVIHKYWKLAYHETLVPVFACFCVSLISFTCAIQMKGSGSQFHPYEFIAVWRYATGHETSPFLPLAQFWAVGDTTSGTRVYGTRTFSSHSPKWHDGSSNGSYCIVVRKANNNP